MDTCRVFFAVLSASGGSGFIHGFHAGLLNILGNNILDWYTDIKERRDPLHSYRDYTLIKPAIWAAFPIGGFFGGLLIALTVFACGRKPPIICYNALHLLSLFLTSYSFLVKAHEVLTTARALLGLCAGLSSGVTIIYIVEIAPYCVRGTAGCFYYIMVMLSVLLSYVMSLHGVLGRHKVWPLIFILCYGPVFAQAAFMCFCPESPKFLYFNKNDDDGGESALVWLGGDEHEIDEMHEEGVALDHIGSVPFKRLFKDQLFRTPLVIGTVLILGQQLCGFTPLIYYGVDHFIEMGYNYKIGQNLSICLIATNIVAAIICTVLVDRIGRFILLLASFGGMAVSLLMYLMLALLASYDEFIPQNTVHAATAFLFLYAIMFGLGAGPIPWFYVAEISNHYARPSTVTIAISLGWFAHFIVVFTFPFLLKAMNEYVFVLYLIPNILTLLFVVLTFRETKGLNGIELTELFVE